MSKIILEFDGVEEREEARQAQKAHEYVDALDVWAEVLRQVDKYGDTPNTTWGEVRDLFWHTMRDEGVADDLV
jgi:hypothetical protein